jgi:hypothetical protein
MVRRRLHPAVGINPPRPILTPVAHLVPMKDVWSCLSRGYLGIWLVFMSIGVISDQSLSIYGFDHWQWLLLW